MSVRIDERFIELINENLGIAHKICRAYFPEAADREDIFQEMMYQLWRSYPAFDNRSKFSTWMYRVCLNTVLSYNRKNKTNRTVPLTERHMDISDLPETTLNEDIAGLFKAINKLSDLNKAIILMYLHDMSYEEIASVTGISKSNVSVRLVRIKKELETLLSTID